MKKMNKITALLYFSAGSCIFAPVLDNWGLFVINRKGIFDRGSELNGA